MLIEVCPNNASPVNRCCVINPKTLRSSCGSASAQRVKLSIDHKSVIFRVELDGKVPVGRCFIPTISFSYIGMRAALSLPEIPSLLESVNLKRVHEGESDSFPLDVKVTKHISLLLDGCCLTDSEPIVVSVNGSLQSFLIQCTPKEGQFSASTTRLVLAETAEVHDDNRVRGFGLVGGLAHVIDELIKTVRKPLLSSDVYHRFGINPPKGILLYGPPGTGKTLLVKALSEELPGILVETIKGTDLCGSDSDARIHNLFRQVQRKAKESGLNGALIFIDEIDSLCPSRDSGVTEAERRAVASLLTEMDGFDTKQYGGGESSLSVVVIGATNRPNALDIALRRAGRFEREIEIAPPDGLGRAEILRVLAKAKFASIWNPSNDDIQDISSLTQGFVGADLVSLLSRAAFKAVEESADRITKQDILDQLIHVRPSALRELAVSVPKTRWDDIGGYEDVKSQLIEAVIWPLEHSDTFIALSVEPPRGVLLYGPPGCSKTMMARAVATESSMNFIAIKGPEVFSKWVGQSEQAIRDIFRKARQASPCVIFFDEIDAIAAQRESGDSGVTSRVLTSILTEMDGVSTLKQVVVIAATNRPEVIDPALVRPGRLDRLVYVGLPDAEARSSILRSALSKVPHRLQEERPEFIEELTAATEGYSGAEIVMLVKEAAIESMRKTLAIPKTDSNLADELAAMRISNRPPQLGWVEMDSALRRTINHFRVIEQSSASATLFHPHAWHKFWSYYASAGGDDFGILPLILADDANILKREMAKFIRVTDIQDQVCCVREERTVHNGGEDIAQLIVMPSDPRLISRMHFHPIFSSRMTLEDDIHALQNHVAAAGSELGDLENRAHHLMAVKAKTSQTLLDLADCRVLLDAIYNSNKGLIKARADAVAMSFPREKVADECRTLGEEIYKRNDEITRCKTEIRSIADQMKLVESNQEALHASLVRLKAKTETHRVRSAGAESELLQLKRQTADEESRYTEAVREASTGIHSLESKREIAALEVQDSIRVIEEELRELRAFLSRQASFLRT